MHPALVLVPAAALVLGPRLWVGYVLKKHNRHDLASVPRAAELARELLDKNRLQIVRVEGTDVGDHYDPVAKAVRLSRDRIDRKTLTAVTTAAHEVAHALQDASGYGPFVLRMRLVKVAQRAGEVGAVLFLAIPLSAMISQHPLPPVLIGAAALAMLGTGVIVQLAALPSELDASFSRALPMLRDGYIGEQQGQDARRILFACSLTYVASSLVSVLHIWPWLGRPPVAVPAIIGPASSPKNALEPARVPGTSHRVSRVRSSVPRTSKRKRMSLLETLVRPIGKPLIRFWLRATDTTR